MLSRSGMTRSCRCCPSASAARFAERATASSARRGGAGRVRLLRLPPRSCLGSELADRLEHPVAWAALARRGGGAGSCRAVTGACPGRRRTPPRQPRTYSRRRRRRAPGRALLSVSSSRSYDHSIVARSVCWRGSASRPALSRSSRWDRRSRSCSGEKTTVRAAASSSASGRLSSRAQSSATAGELSHPGVERPRPGQEELDAVVVRQRGHRVHVLALELQALAARDEERRPCDVAKPRDLLVRSAGRRCSALSRSSSARLPARRSARLSASSRPGCSSTCERLGERRDEQVRVAQRRQRHPPDAVGIRLGRLGRRLDREPRLAGAARPGQRQEPRRSPCEQLHDLGQLVLAPEERRRRNRQVRPIEALQRRELASPSW